MKHVIWFAVMVVDCEIYAAPQAASHASSAENSLSWTNWKHRLASVRLSPRFEMQGGGHHGDNRPLPEFISGDECLFCHRFEGSQWQDNRHNLTIRQAFRDPSALAALKNNMLLRGMAGEVEHVMGHRNRIRFLRNGAGYGRLDLLSAELVPARPDKDAAIVHGESPRWDTTKFALQCAGCHTTQMNSKSKSFAAISLDCYVCHGPATQDHTKDTTKILFARDRKDRADVVVSICGQCHLRGGQSKSTGLPFPNNFIAGGDLFSDFAVDFDLADDPHLNPGDRHVYHSARETMRGRSEWTCLSCHSVHGGSAAKHRRVAESSICLICHNAGGPKSLRKPYDVHSTVCGY